MQTSFLIKKSGVLLICMRFINHEIYNLGLEDGVRLMFNVFEGSCERHTFLHTYIYTLGYMEIMLMFKIEMV